MANATTLLTLEEFNSQYGCENGYEYWFGEVVPKGAGTWLHGVLQFIVGEFLRRVGYIGGISVDLRIDPNWQPRPDIAAALCIEEPYPTKPVEIVVEILSPDDPMARVFEKCRHYARIGIPQIFVLDPESKTAWEWSRQTHNLETIQTLHLANGSTLPLTEIWAELDARMRMGESSPE
jgi:Uma2 family endonuclease